MGTRERPSTSENDTLTDGWLSPPPPETEQTPTTPDLGTENPEASTTVPNSGDAETNTAIARVIVNVEAPEQAAQPENTSPFKLAQKPLTPTVRRIIPHPGWRPPETTPDKKPASDEIPKNPILGTRTTIAIAAITALTTLYVVQKAFKTPSKPDISATTPSVKVPNPADAGTDSGTVTKQATPSASASQAPIASANVAPSKTAAPATSATSNPKTKTPRAPRQRHPGTKGDDSNNYNNGEIVTPKGWDEEPGL
ncbi:MAG: hypothetical protein WC843_05330 [Candidatus Gracilibacteria bacterium]|jgi:hypothetical protein